VFDIARVLGERSKEPRHRFFVVEEIVADDYVCILVLFMVGQTGEQGFY
jgi:hypothetical protein